MRTTDEMLYSERLSSWRTEALFLVLTVLFLGLGVRRFNAGNRDALAVVLLCLFAFFLFYALNYRTLLIRVTAESLKLKFGIVTWLVSLDNIETCRQDDLPLLLRLGGAGVHFMLVGGRYRVLFNFLEHPRITITLKKPRGAVRDISFSTRRPHDMLRLINDAISANGAAQQAPRPGSVVQ
jgi:hypothetical protein